MRKGTPNQLINELTSKIEDLVVSVAWNSDEENIYMDANFIDGHVITFTIPKADLAYDLENTDMDVEYICQAVRDTAEYENEPVLELEAPADEELPVYM